MKYAWNEIQTEANQDASREWRDALYVHKGDAQGPCLLKPASGHADENHVRWHAVNYGSVKLLLRRWALPKKEHEGSSGPWG